MENYLKVIIITMIILMLLASSLFIFPPSTIACNLYSSISIPFRPEQVKVIRNLLNSFQFIKKIVYLVVQLFLDTLLSKPSGKHYLLEGFKVAGISGFFQVHQDAVCSILRVR